MVLLGGDPGIGKSTLALQAAVYAQKQGKGVLYVSGEESAHQIKMRASRLDSAADLLVLPETNLETILATLMAEQPELVIIDSIQTMNSQEVNGVVGGVSQISYATNILMRIAKEYHIAILIIGHVTKEGMLAGPKTLEHMVDTVLYLEGERFTSLRLLRSNKNRFGSAGEVGVFQMSEAGLEEVKNPSALFLEQRDKPLAGSCTTAILEGNKVLLLEVQALTSSTSFGYPRRTTSGFDLN
jgi:DNA repair protein RadA/Sms